MQARSGEAGRASAPARSPAHWGVLALALALPLGVLVLAHLVEPDARGYGTHEALGLAPCRVVELFGLPCPGCGVTTAVVLAGRGRLLEAWLTQPFGALAALATLAVAFWALAESLRGRDLWARLARLAWWRWAAPVGVAVLGAWVYKIVAMRVGG